MNTEELFTPLTCLERAQLLDAKAEMPSTSPLRLAWSQLVKKKSALLGPIFPLTNTTRLIFLLEINPLVAIIGLEQMILEETYSLDVGGEQGFLFL